MEIIVYSDGDTPLHRLDPRSRVLAAVAFSAVLALAGAWPVLLFGLLLGIAGALVARIPPAALLQRLVPLNAVLALLLAALLFFTPGEALFHIGPAGATREGLQDGLIIALKANAIVLLLAVLLGTIELVALGHALERLGMPPKLAHLLLFTVRYLGLMLAEYSRLSTAARLRGFAPGPNLHTVRTTGYMAGMMLVRSHARGERIRDAMRLRGYRGSLAFHGDLAFQRSDAWFGLLSATAMLAMLGMVWP